jgi:hypothetical protein
VTILVAILCLAFSACVESQPALPKPTVYEWLGTGPYPSSQRLAHDRYACAQDADRNYPQEANVSDRWKAHQNRCMQSKGWGQKAID